jgi:hypothetical protein
MAELAVTHLDTAFTIHIINPVQNLYFMMHLECVKHEMLIRLISLDSCSKCRYKLRWLQIKLKLCSYNSE